MQNTQMINYYKIQLDNEIRKKEEILNLSFFKILEKENQSNYIIIYKYIENKSADEIEDIIKYIFNKKSVQKICIL